MFFSKFIFSLKFIIIIIYIIKIKLFKQIKIKYKYIIRNRGQLNHAIVVFDHLNMCRELHQNNYSTKSYVRHLLTFSL